MQINLLQCKQVTHVSIRKQKVHESVEWLVGVVHDKKDWKMSNVSTLHEKQTTRNY